jgi:hypothetical protein
MIILANLLEISARLGKTVNRVALNRVCIKQISSDFRVKDSLPNITFPVQQSFAGNIPVNRAGHPNNTLFFVGFEKSNGSLTAAPEADKDSPWGIWLNGGWVVLLC